MAIYREISSYTRLHLLEANKVWRDRQGERGAARRWCERPTMSRGRSVHLRGTILDIGGVDGEKKRGEVCVCGRHTWLERYIDRCVPERRSQGPTYTAG